MVWQESHLFSGDGSPRPCPSCVSVCSTGTWSQVYGQRSWALALPLCVSLSCYLRRPPRLSQGSALPTAGSPVPRPVCGVLLALDTYLLCDE